ncbi:hypothetical protein BT69DRAFT_1360181 [Atractiella rhizophila]|nr:hypothetical protein BT69DRAFT_1360181 [Atractiella rhizophila]
MSVPWLPPTLSLQLQELSLNLTTEKFFRSEHSPPLERLPVNKFLSLFSNLQALNLHGAGWDETVFRILPVSLKRLQMHLGPEKVTLTVEVDSNSWENISVQEQWITSFDSLEKDLKESGRHWAVCDLTLRRIPLVGEWMLESLHEYLEQGGSMSEIFPEGSDDEVDFGTELSMAGGSGSLPVWMC